MTIGRYYHEDQAIQMKARMFFTGDTALDRGVGLCHDLDHVTTNDGETASDDWEKRDKAVQLPDESTNLAFAGIVEQSYEAKSGGQWVSVILPGSTCKVRTDQNLTIDTDIITCLARTDGDLGSVGTFYKGGFAGRGSAVPLQTIDRSSTDGLALVRLMTGQESGLVEELTPVANGAMTDPMVGGVTFLSTAVDLTAGASTATLADAEIAGQRKLIRCEAAMTADDVELTVTNHETADPETLYINADGELALMEWSCDEWVNIHLTAATTATA